MSTADKLNALVLTKADIKLALIDKGLNPSDVFSTYADNIRAIETGSGSGGVFDFAAIGYTGNEEPLKSGLAYAKEIYDNWKIGNTNNYYNDDKLIIFPKVDVNLNTNINIRDCKNLIIFPQIEMNNLSSASNTRFFEGCSYLKVLPLMNYSNWTKFNSMFKGCSNLIELGTIDCSSATMLSSMFWNCSKLPYNPLVNVTNNLTSLDYLFSGCNSLLTLGDISNWNVSGVTDFTEIFSGCNQLTTIDISNWDMSNATKMNAAFSGCGYLTELKLPYNIGKSDMAYTFKNCSSLAVIPSINTEYTTTFSAPFDGCTKLIRVEGISMKSYPSDISRSTIFAYSNNTAVRYLLIKDLGTSSNLKTIQFLNLINWGVETETTPLSIGAKQSLIDSLITYSYDRALAGYTACKVTLSTNTKALLTEDEIAQITAKGFTIA